MNKMLETVKEQGVPLDSVVAAAQHLGLSGIGVLADSEYVNRIHELTDKTVSYEDSDSYRIVYSYLCTEVIARSNNTDKLNADELLTIAEKKAKVLITDNPWFFAKSETEPKLDDEGNAKPKKGAKKELAMKVYAEDIKDKVTVRKEAIAILVEKAGLTPAGASTYYANLKKNDGVL